jgi:nitrous oxidase accessory protein NosD
MSKDPLRVSKNEAPSCGKGLKPVLDRSDSQPASSSVPRAWRVRRFLIANVAILVCVALICSTLIFAFSSLPARTEAYTVRGPIVIDHSDDWSNPAVSGVVGGSGTPSDPYIISGWQIIVSSGEGIRIKDQVAVSFVIKDVEVTVGSGSGIYLYNVVGGSFAIQDVHVNGTANPTGTIKAMWFFYADVANWYIEDCLINDTHTGLDLDWCDDGSVQRTSFLDISGWAADMSACRRVHFVGNHFESANGIAGTGWEYSNVVLNDFVNTGMCVSAGSLSKGIVVKENVATDCSVAVTFAGSSTDMQVQNNHFVNCMDGITFNSVTYSDIRGNVIEGSTRAGIWIGPNSYTATITDNVVSGTDGLSAIYLDGCWDVNITRNVLSDNIADTGGFGTIGGGVSVDTGCTEMLIYNNSFVNNIPQQAEDASSDFVNLWNKTYPVGGNYWSDYSGIDDLSGPDQDLPGSDGFGDEPYDIDGDSFDHYPRMVPVPATIRPMASFDAAPVPGDTIHPISFDASSSYHPDSTKSITGYRWDFQGDGIFDTGYLPAPTTSHQYSVIGDYTVILEVVDQDGMTDIVTFVITIQSEPIPEFGTVLVPVLSVVVLIAVAIRRRAQVS